MRFQALDYDTKLSKRATLRVALDLAEAKNKSGPKKNDSKQLQESKAKILELNALVKQHKNRAVSLPGRISFSIMFL